MRGRKRPVRMPPIKPTAEFARTRMKGADSAAVCFGDVHCSGMSVGARKTPPPTPVRLEISPTAPPT